MPCITVDKFVLDNSAVVGWMNENVWRGMKTDVPFNLIWEYPDQKDRVTSSLCIFVAICSVLMLEFSDAVMYLQ